MRRETSMFVLKPDMVETVENAVKSKAEEINALCEKLGAMNAGVWCVEHFLYLYAEFEDDCAFGIKDLIKPYETMLMIVGSQIGSNKDMELMYHCIGVVRKDKSLIRRRVFATELKPGCAREYKRRHQELIDARGDEVSDGPETNFTIRCAGDRYIFGYCELVKSYDHEPTEEEKAATVSWETRGLEIMDWLTDDCDWIFGTHHQAMRTLFIQKGFE